MFVAFFKEELEKLTANHELVDELVSELTRQYSKPGRFYHNLSHLDNLYVNLSLVGDRIYDKQTLLFSIAYHDIVYNTLKQNNEEKSADLAVKRLKSIGLSQNQISLCNEQILATKRHFISENSDTNYFTDADLAILGSDSGQYSAYTKAIRKEYSFYPDLLYKPGRKKVLENFLAMQKIYKTDYFFDRFEEQARINIAAELNE